MNYFPVKVIENGILWGRASDGTKTTLEDETKNLTVNAFVNKLIKVWIDGIEYVRTITANTSNTFTFAALVTAVSATAVLEKTGGGKVTITSLPAGTQNNGFRLVTVKGEGEEADTEAEFADGVLTITLGTGSGVHSEGTIGTPEVNYILVQAKVAEPNEDYSIDIQLQTGEDLPLAVGVNLETGLITVSLGTDEDGLPDDTKNTVANIVTALNDNIYFKEVFTAASNAGTGVHNTALTAVAITGGASPAIDATAADVKTAVDLLTDEFTAVADTAGVLDVVDPITFSGGVDEVKVLDRTEYFVI